MTEGQYLTGRLLLALPGMPDPRFAHAVIAMCMHDAQGALGLGVGHLIPGVGLHQLLDDLEIDARDAPDAPVHAGGPVEPQRGFVLHTTDWSGPGTVDAGPFGALSTSIDVLRAIASNTGPSRWLVALGYAGWGAGQLEHEIRENAWLVCEPDEALLFGEDHAGKWARALAKLGVSLDHLSGEAGRA